MNFHFKEDYKKKFNNLKKIGTGNYTEIFQSENKINHELRAIKVIKLDDIKRELEEEYSTEEVNKIIKDYINILMKEIDNMITCGDNNKNSIKFYESFETENELAIVMELCDINLNKFKKNKSFNSSEIYEIIHQLNNTFKIMKDKKIVHRNLKPNNILIKYEKDNKYIMKLCDYGTEENFTKIKIHKKTTYYTSPEIIKASIQSNDNYKCDLWSLGVIIYELFFGEKLFKGLNEYALIEEINNFEKSKLKKTNDEKLDDLISKLLEKYPEKRITWDDYFNHPFLKINSNEITIQYKKTDKYGNDYGNKIKIFGKKFVENNKDKCKFIYKCKDYELQEYLELEKNEQIFEIKLFGINKVTNMSFMFSECILLTSLPDISNWDTNNVTNMSYMFNYCESLKSLDDISFWNTSNVNNMSYMFSDCKSLVSLPDISNWNTNKVTNISGLFYNCISLKSLPDISKWDTNNIINMSDLFSSCRSLKSLPDISKWDTIKVKYLYYIFYNCKSLKTLPDISKWKTNNVTNISYIFADCSQLQSLPDISKWNTDKVSNMSYMFFNCYKLNSLPDISKWNTRNVTNISCIFKGCRTLKSLPDISNWNTNNVTNMSCMFKNCRQLKSLPDISKWNTSNINNMSSLFSGCSSLESLPDILQWNLKNAIDISYMFSQCRSLEYLPDILKWNLKNVTNMNHIFEGINLSYLPKFIK